MIQAMIAEILCTVGGAILIITGFIGCVVPALPGPLLSYLSLIVLSLPGQFSLFNPWLLIVMGIIALGAQILDNIFPVLSSKKAGAGKPGIGGSIIGMLLGMIFFPPLGVILGAFLGAFLGEILFNRENTSPLKAAMGVFTGTMLGILLKFVICGIIAAVFIGGILKIL